MQAAEDGDEEELQVVALPTVYDSAMTEPQVPEGVPTLDSAGEQGGSQGWQVASKRGRHAELAAKAGAQGRRQAGHAGASAQSAAHGKQGGR